MFNPSRAWTVSTSFSVLGKWLAAVVYTCSRVSYSSTLSTSGVMRCTPGYNVPGRAPQIWLTRTPANPSGTTAMLYATKRGSTPAAASRWASPQRTGRKGRANSAFASSGAAAQQPAQLRGKVNVINNQRAGAAEEADAENNQQIFQDEHLLAPFLE